MRLDELSDALRAALERAEPGAHGMKTVRAVGPDGHRYTAGLAGGEVLLLRLPWPNPSGSSERLDTEPQGLTWHPHQHEPGDAALSMRLRSSESDETNMESGGGGIGAGAG